jgi:hypothetical protein
MKREPCALRYNWATLSLVDINTPTGTWYSRLGGGMGRLTTLLFKKITVTKPKEVKTRSNLAESLRKSMAQKVMFCESDDDDDICSSHPF